jgi:hypothetical protein
VDLGKRDRKGTISGKVISGRQDGLRIKLAANPEQMFIAFLEHGALSKIEHEQTSPLAMPGWLVFPEAAYTTVLMAWLKLSRINDRLSTPIMGLS